MDLFNVYTQAIAISLIIIVSYFFNYVSKKTNIPSVLLLIILGVGIQKGLNYLHVDLNMFLGEVLELLGVVGLIMIVLEAALDLKLEKNKKKLLFSSLLSALIGLVVTTLVTAVIFQLWIFNPYITDITEAIKYNFPRALIYAIPLSILSSAIIIPSVGQLMEKKKEFLIYESTFADILGIMFFYFVIGQREQNMLNIVANVSINIVSTIVLSLSIGYLMVLLLQNMQGKLKLFFLIAILILIYSIGKLSNLSSLLIIMVFGLILNNYNIFFFGRTKRWINEKALNEVTEDFHTVTLETAFVIRTFFFIFFGITLDFSGVTELEPILIASLVLALTYLIRYLLLKGLTEKNITPQLWVAPRGLITVLLFFSIPTEFQTLAFNPTILLLIIITSNVIMTIGLVTKNQEKEDFKELNFKDWDELDEQVTSNQITKK